MLACKRRGWQPHPREARATVHAWDGRWPTVLPVHLLRVVVVCCPARTHSRQPGQRQPPPPLEAFFTTDLTLSLEAILTQYRNRWTVEVCQTPPVKMPWGPLRLLTATIIDLRGGVKREHVRDLGLLPGDDDFLDQALGDGLAISERQALQLVA